MARLIKLRFALPPTLNEQISMARTGWQPSAKSKANWTEYIMRECLGHRGFTGQVWIKFNWFVRNLACDPDNVSAAAKYLMDGIVKAGIIEDDSLKIIQSPVLHFFTKSKDKEVLITISDRPDFLITAINKIGEVYPDVKSKE